MTLVFQPLVPETHTCTLREATSAASILIVDSHYTEVGLIDSADNLQSAAATDGQPCFIVEDEDASANFLYADFEQEITLTFHQQDGTISTFVDKEGKKHSIEFFNGYQLTIGELVVPAVMQMDPEKFNLMTVVDGTVPEPGVTHEYADRCYVTYGCYRGHVLTAEELRELNDSRYHPFWIDGHWAKFY